MVEVVSRTRIVDRIDYDGDSQAERVSYDETDEEGLPPSEQGDPADAQVGTGRGGVVQGDEKP